MEISEMNWYDTLLTVDKKILEDGTDKTKYEVVTTELKFVNKTAYNDLILTQEYMVCFHIIEEAKTKIIGM